MFFDSIMLAVVRGFHAVRIAAAIEFERTEVYPNRE
jgi:hypothetical protein